MAHALDAVRSLLECCNLRVKDRDFAQNQLLVHAGKGNKDRYTTLPASLG